MSRASGADDAPIECGASQELAAFGPCSSSSSIVAKLILDCNDFLQELADVNSLTPCQALDLFAFKTSSSSDGGSPLPASLKRKYPMPDESAMALGACREIAVSGCALPVGAQNRRLLGAAQPSLPRSWSVSPTQLRDDVLSLLTMKQQDSLTVEDRVEAALSIPSIEFTLLAPKTAEGHVVLHGMRLLDSSTAFFKIGITENPAHRWTRPDGGYEHTPQQRGVMVKRMLVIYASDTTHTAGMLESALIMYGRLKWPLRCLNEKPGGEGKSIAGSLPHFTYIVFS